MGTHISVSKGCEHADYPPGFDGCIRTDTIMIGYLFQPAPQINGCCMTWIYIDNLKGSIPGSLVQKLANLMHKKTFIDMNACMIKFKNNELNLDDSTQDVLFKEDVQTYSGWQEKVVK